MLVSCNDGEEEFSLGEVTMGEIKAITAKSAVVLGSVESVGGGVVNHGHCWSTSPGPTLEDDHTSLGNLSAPADFKSNLSGLSIDQKYFIRAFIEGGGSVEYSAEQEFTTLDGIPELVTSMPSRITSASALLGGYVLDNGGLDFMEVGVVWNETGIPTTEDTKVSISEIYDGFASDVMGLESAKTYYTRSYVLNEVGAHYGNELSFVAQDVEKLIDIDGNEYFTVAIGQQIWMAENLRTTKLKDGTELTKLTESWENGSDPAYAWFEDNENNKETLGALYNEKAAKFSELCPEGWHLPTRDEWLELADELGGLDIAGRKLKHAGTNHWLAPNYASNESGFMAMPSGSVGSFGGYSNPGLGADWFAVQGNIYTFNRTDSLIVGYHDSYENGLAVRCIKNK